MPMGTNDGEYNLAENMNEEGETIIYEKSLHTRKEIKLESY